MTSSQLTLSRGAISRVGSSYVVFDAASGSSGTINFDGGGPITEEGLLLILTDRLRAKPAPDHRLLSYIEAALGILQSQAPVDPISGPDTAG